MSLQGQQRKNRLQIASYSNKKLSKKWGSLNLFNNYLGHCPKSGAQSKLLESKLTGGIFHAEKSYLKFNNLSEN